MQNLYRYFALAQGVFLLKEVSVGQCIIVQMNDLIRSENTS